MQPTLSVTQQLQLTEHPHVVRVAVVHVAGVGNGESIIGDSRISVRLIAEYYKAGLTVDDVQRDYPQLNPAAIYDAISYDIDHQDEIETLIEANRIESVLDRTGYQLREDGTFYRN